LGLSWVNTDATESAPSSLPSNDPTIFASWPTPGKANPGSPLSSDVTAKPEKTMMLDLMLLGVQVVVAVIAREEDGVETLPRDSGNWSRPAHAFVGTVIVNIVTPPDTAETFDPDAEQ